MIIRLIGWLIYRLGPRTLLSLTLLLAAVGSVALGLADEVRGLDAGLLLPVAVLGLLVGWGLGKSPLPGWLGAFVALGLGVEAVVLRVGRLGGPLVALLRALADGSIKLAVALIGGVWRPGGLPLAHRSRWLGWPLNDLPDETLLALGELWAGVGTLLARLRDWSLALATGEPGFDPVAVALVWSLALWAAAAWAGWSVRRHDRPLPGMTPAGVLLSGSLFYVRGNPTFLLPLLGATLLLVVLMRQYARERRWEATGVDFPLDVGQEVAFGGAALSLMLVMAAMLTPSISVRQVAEWAGRLIGGRTGEAQPVASSLGLDPRGSGSATILDQDQVRAPGLPRRHLLGSGPELSEQVLMVVYFPEGHEGIEDELSPGQPGGAAPRYYWRGLTYDQYTGRGWIAGRTETLEYQAGELAIFKDRFEPPGVDSQSILMTSPGRRQVRVEVRAVGDIGELLYVAGDLVTADLGYRVAWRSPHDAFGATMASTASRPSRRAGRTGGRNQADRARPEDSSIIYRADSLVPAVGEAQLQAAGNDYPAWVRDRYLALPDKVPARVLAQARDLTAIEPTPYDRARAIEAYLRTFPYTLDLTPPPVHRDVVDYFLFDLRQGYCDYYATSMVVLARAAGLPARLAVGYFSGTYDEANARYVVTEADAHSWVEIYFPDYGWIEFEPTAGRSPIDRPADVPPIVPPALERLEPIAVERARGAWLWWTVLPGVVVLLVLGGVVWSVVDGWLLRRLTPKAAVVVLYGRLHRHGRRLAVPVQPGDTPYEFVASFAECVAGIAWAKRWDAALAPAVQESHWLVDLFVRTCYGPHSPGAADQGQAIQTWRRLRRRLWLAWAYQAGSSGLIFVFSRSAHRVGRLPTD